MEQEEKNKSKSKAGLHGCLICIIIFIVCAGILGLVLYMQLKPHINNDNNTAGSYNPLTRNATLNDITITGDDLDLSSFGEKLTFTPKKDIDGLKLKFVFQKSNGTKLQTIEKSIGNVKEGKQYSVTISIMELEWDVVKNVFDIQCKYTVSAGTVSYSA